MAKLNALGNFFINLGIAIRNTFYDIWRVFKDRRLWIAILLSLFIHTAIFIIGMWNEIMRGKQNVEDYQLTEVSAYDPSHRRATKKVVQKQRIVNIVPSASGSSKGVVLKRRMDLVQTVDVGEVNLDQRIDLSLGGDILAINPNAKRASLDELLSMPEVKLTGGKTNASGLINIQMGSNVDLTSKSDISAIESDLQKQLESSRKSVATAKVTEEVSKSGASFSIRGELSGKDIVSKTNPPFPNWARQRGFRQVTVKIRFEVDSNGNVLPNIAILGSSGNKGWDNLVVSALRRWKFTNSSAPRRWAIITFIFRLK